MCSYALSKINTEKVFSNKNFYAFYKEKHTKKVLFAKNSLKNEKGFEHLFLIGTEKFHHLG